MLCFDEASPSYRVVNIRELKKTTFLTTRLTLTGNKLHVFNQSQFCFFDVRVVKNVTCLSSLLRSITAPIPKPFSITNYRNLSLGPVVRRPFSLNGV